jgi:thioredoxin reductase (NADPH)
MKTQESTAQAIVFEFSSVPPSAFAGLSESTIHRLQRYGHEEMIAAATILFLRGDRDVDMFVVIEGEIELFENTGHAEERLVACLRSSQFTGELDLLDNRRTLLGGRTAKLSRILRIGRANLKKIMRTEPEIAGIIMQSCIGRRCDIVRHAAGGVVLIGPGHSADTIRLQRFLTRIGHPYRMLDAEKYESACSMMELFILDHDQLPAALLPDGRVLRNPSNALLADELGITDLRESSKVYDVAIVGALHYRHRRHSPRWPGRNQFTHRELSRLSHRPVRAGTLRAFLGAGAKVRRRIRNLARRPQSAEVRYQLRAAP